MVEKYVYWGYKYTSNDGRNIRLRVLENTSNGDTNIRIIGGEKYVHGIRKIRLIVVVNTFISTEDENLFKFKYKCRSRNVKLQLLGEPFNVVPHIV